jgi:hypothetical protein
MKTVLPVMKNFFPIIVPKISQIEGPKTNQTQSFIDVLGGRKIDTGMKDYLSGHRDIISLAPEVATFVAKFEAFKNIVEATTNIPKTLMSMQI